jgi:hypothetical protein
MGNVIVLSVVDSTLIKGASFMDKGFEVLNINQKEVLVKITSLQFWDTVIKVTYNGQPKINLGNIIVTTRNKQLGEVRVTSQAPMVRYNPNGNVEVNVAKTILASSSSVNEILSRSPNIMIGDDGQLTVIGKGEAIIYQNGKRITREQMSGIPTSQISKIEIISNPSARYDAEGKAVINIVTKMNTQEGVIGRLSQHVSVSDFGGTTANTFLDVSYMRGKFSLIGNYGLMMGDTREFLYTTRTRPPGADFMRSEMTMDWKRDYKNSSTFGLGAQYNFDEKRYLSLGYNGYFDDLNVDQRSRNTITTNSGANFYSSDVAVNLERWNHSATLNYNHAIDSLGSAFFVGGQYSYYTSGNNDFIAESSRSLKNLSDLGIHISTIQIDYTKAFNSKDRLELGVKFGYVTNTSFTDFLIAESGGDFKPSEQLSNSFKYIEKIPAAYINYSGKLTKRIDISLGTRGEMTDYYLRTSVKGGQVLEKNYFNFFPNLSLNTAVKQVKLRASYVSRISRPRYQALNPFVIYQDPYTTIEGNPFLVPEKTHAFEFSANYKKYDFRVGYNYTLNPFSGAALRGDSANAYVLKSLNLEKDHTFFASASRSVSLKWWTSLNTVTLSYSKSFDNTFGYAFGKTRPYVYLYTSNTFTVKDLFKIQMLAWYMSNKSYGVRHERDRSTVTLSVEKDLFKNALKLTFTANDIFHGTNTEGNYDVGQTAVYYDRTYTTNYFRFIATWNFGKLKKSNYKIKATGQSESNRAN